MMDRRVDDRVAVARVSARVGGTDYELVNLSLGGARLRGLAGAPGDRLSVELADGVERIAVPATILAVDADGASVAFGAPTYALMTFLARHIE